MFLFFIVYSNFKLFFVNQIMEFAFFTFRICGKLRFDIHLPLKKCDLTHLSPDGVWIFANLKTFVNGFLIV